MATGPRLLLIATREIGDVLLVTPLVRSLKSAYPRSDIDVLVFRGKGGMLQGNPDVSRLIEVTESPGWGEFFSLLRRLCRRYRLAVTVQSGDRPMLYAWCAASRRYGIVASMRRQEAWKRWMLDGWTLLDNLRTHTVVQNLRLAELLGIERDFAVVPPFDPASADKLAALLGFDFTTEPYVVLHPYPRWRYKHWRDKAWLRTAEFINRSRLRVVLTGGPSAHEISGCQRLANSLSFPVADLAGRLSLADLSVLYEHAKAYVGPDTATTHLAAACGTPVLAIYGPSNPMKWAPWPKAVALSPSETSPFKNRAPVQKIGNVWVLQPGDPCVPCYQEGCDRHRGSEAQCLEHYPETRVTEILSTLFDK